MAGLTKVAGEDAGMRRDVVVKLNPREGDASALSATEANMVVNHFPKNSLEHSGASTVSALGPGFNILQNFPDKP